MKNYNKRIKRLKMKKKICKNKNKSQLKNIKTTNNYNGRKKFKQMKLIL